MAFCPHCGDRASDADTQCGKCGQSLTPAKKKARFAGTMMMDHGVASGGAASPGDPPNPGAPPAGGSPTSPGPSQLQATLVGERSPTPAVASLRKPGSAGVRPSVDAALADTAPRSAASGQASDQAPRYLVGDPMAPEGGGPPQQRPAQRAAVPETGARRAHVQPAPDKGSTLLIVTVLGLISIGGIGYAVAAVLGLI